MSDAPSRSPAPERPADRSASGSVGAPSDERPRAFKARPPGRAPGDYRPDLRPILILGGLLVAVVIAWLLLSPLILPG
jgi:hypothetical protein